VKFETCWVFRDREIFAGLAVCVLCWSVVADGGVTPKFVPS
jgi:hypothetical protein